MTITQSQQPDTLGQEDELSSHQCKVYLETGGWYRVRGRSDTAMVLQISSMYAEIARLTAENEALRKKPAPLTDVEKHAMWAMATIDQCSHEQCYLRGINDSEAAHGIVQNTA